MLKIQANVRNVIYMSRREISELNSVFLSIVYVKEAFFFFQLTHEEEEAERRELQKLLSEDKPSKESVSKTSVMIPAC